MGSSDFGVTCLKFQPNILLGGLDRQPGILSGIQVAVVSGRLKVDEDLKQTNEIVGTGKSRHLIGSESILSGFNIWADTIAEKVCQFLS
jgi:hypothetical protein